MGNTNEYEEIRQLNDTIRENRKKSFYKRKSIAERKASTRAATLIGFIQREVITFVGIVATIILGRGSELTELPIVLWLMYGSFVAGFWKGVR